MFLNHKFPLLQDHLPQNISQSREFFPSLERMKELTSVPVAMQALYAGFARPSHNAYICVSHNYRPGVLNYYE